jgi:hypothetical protein
MTLSDWVRAEVDAVRLAAPRQGGPAVKRYVAKLRQWAAAPAEPSPGPVSHLHPNRCRRRFGIHQGWPWPLLPHRPQTLGAAAHPAEPSPGHASHHPPNRCRAVPLGPSPYRSLTAAVICEQHGGGDARIRAVRSVGTPLTAARPSGDAFLCRVIAGGRPKGSSA